MSQSINFFCGSPLDRADFRRKDTAWLEQAFASNESYFVVLSEGSVWFNQDEKRVLVNRNEFSGALDDAPSAFLGTWDGLPVFSLQCAEPMSDAWALMSVREIAHMSIADEAAIAAHASALDIWHKRTKFCSQCGSGLKAERAGHVLRCTNEECGIEHFPRVDTAVIMLVHDGGDRILLGRSKHWPENMFSVLAGFLEPGESLEEAVAREVYEESGIRVRDVQYKSSQPWPFPSSLMVGFSCEAKNLAINIDPDELEAAAWYSREELLLPKEERPVSLPPRISISRQLINDWLYHPERY